MNVLNSKMPFFDILPRSFPTSKIIFFLQRIALECYQLVCFNFSEIDIHFGASQHGIMARNMGLREYYRMAHKFCEN